MGWIERPSQPFEAVSLTDDALVDCSPKQIKQYSDTRDIKVLEVEKLLNKPVVMTCKPLRQRYDEWIDEPSYNQLWAIFANHVIDIKNGPDIRWRKQNNERFIDDNARKIIPPVIIAEIGKVIIEAASKDGVSDPFEAQASLLGSVSRKIIFHAMNANTEDAETTNSNSQTNPPTTGDQPKD